MSQEEHDKAREIISDLTETELMSACCSANLMMFNDGVGLCTDCREWSEGVKAED